MATYTSSKKIWITWEKQVRNRSLAHELDIPIYEIDISASALKRYAISLFKTYKVIKQEKPAVVFHQNPSIILGVFLSLLKRIYRFKTVADTHNAGVFPAEGKYGSLNKIGKFVTCAADLVLVHNSAISDVVSQWGVAPIILPDPLPVVASQQMEAEIKKNQIFFICAWSADEPYQEVIQAAQQLLNNKSDIEIYISGKPPSDFLPTCLPDNIHLTGFVTYEKYIELLTQSAVVMALTKRHNSLNCGGYEALSYAKPCILSNTHILKDFFGDCFFYADCSGESIANTITKALKEIESTTVKMREKRKQYRQEYVEKMKQLNTKLLQL